MTSNDNPAAADAADTTSGELVVGDDGTGTGGSQPPAGVAPAADVVGREPWRSDWWRSASDVSDIVAIGSRSDWQWHRSWWLNSTAIRAAFAAGGEYRCMADASGVLFRAAFNASVAAAGGVAPSPDTIANHQLACVVAATRWLVNSGAVSRAADVGEVVAAREWLNNPTLVAADVAVAAFVEKMMVVSGAPADNESVLTEAVIAAISAINDFLAAQPPATTSSQPPAGVAADGASATGGEPDVVVPTGAAVAGGELVVGAADAGATSGDDGTGGEPPAGVAPADVVGDDAGGSERGWRWHLGRCLSNREVWAAFADGGEYRCIADANHALLRAALKRSIVAAGGNHQLANVMGATRWLLNSGAVSRAAEIGDVAAVREWLKEPQLVAADVAVAAFVEKLASLFGELAGDVATLTDTAMIAIHYIRDDLADTGGTSASALAAIGLPPVPPAAVWWHIDGGLRATYHTGGDGGLLVFLGELRELATTSVDAITLTLHSTSGATTSYLLAGGAANVGELVADAIDGGCW